MWTIKTQDKAGRCLETGETRESLGQAKKAAQELAWEMRNTTFYVERDGRIPAVYHFVKVD